MKTSRLKLCLRNATDRDLNNEEKNALKVFSINAPTPLGGDSSVEELSMVEELKREEDALKFGSNNTSSVAGYAPVWHVSPTSNIVERLFSRAKLITTDQRRSMDPDTLEMILILRLNKDKWDARAVQVCEDAFLREKDERRKEQERAAMEQAEATVNFSDEDEAKA